MRVEFRIAGHFAGDAHEEGALHAVDLDPAVFGEGDDGVDGIVEHDRVAGQPPAVQDLRRVLVMLLADPFVVGGIELEVDDVVENAEEVTVVVAIDAEADAAGMARVRLIDDGLYVILIVDAVVFTFVAFMGKANAWIRGGFNGVAEPFELVWRDPVAFIIEFVVVAAGEMDVFSVMLEVVGIQDDETESVFVEMIISAFHAIALERDFGFTPKITLREGLRAFAEWYNNEDEITPEMIKDFLRKCDSLEIDVR